MYLRFPIFKLLLSSSPKLYLLHFKTLFWCLLKTNFCHSNFAKLHCSHMTLDRSKFFVKSLSYIILVWWQWNNMFTHMYWICLDVHSLVLLPLFTNSIEISILGATLDKGPRNKVQWNRTFLLVKILKLVPRPSDESPEPRRIKLWFNLHHIILEGKPIHLNKIEQLKGKLMVWKTKV
jgi:hypothetical protein